MKKIKPILLLTILLSFSNCAYFAKPASEISLPALFTDNMVLQQNRLSNIWGTATPEHKVTVQFNNQKKTAIADEEGNWTLQLDPGAAGGPFEMMVFGVDTIALKNILVGEVWVCSGQSNMQMPLAGWGEVVNFKQEIAAADYPNIRLFQVKHTTSLTQQNDVDAEPWQECSPETVPEFSSTAYFFGRHLYNELKVPIGLVHTSWGGTIAEAWIAPDFLLQMKDFAEAMQAQNALAEKNGNQQLDFETQMQMWSSTVDSIVAASNSGNTTYEAVEAHDAEWKSISLPIMWEKAGLSGFDGVVWFRKTIELSVEQAAGDFMLSLGPIDDEDVTFINGLQIGATNLYNTPREYPVAAGLLKAGKNVIAVRVLDTGGDGGLWGKAPQMFLKNSAGTTKSLAGGWKYKVGMSLKDMPPRPQSPDNPNRPAVLYNAMLEPLMPLTLRGAIWYQGESNAGRAYQYRELFPTMITSWRTHWKQGNFPFFFVQLANWRKVRENPVESEWAELREAQTLTLSLPNTGMAVAIDIGDAVDIHPKNKQEVGRRLALNALARVYEKDIVFSGPIYKTMSVDGDKIRLEFDHVADGLVAKGGVLTGFAIAGADSQFVWANAEIDGEKIVVSNSKIANPIAVRYAWADNPLCNLYNSAGLPASPFRTDDWDGVTKGVK
jgi:sialate O-acetylesterase